MIQAVNAEVSAVLDTPDFAQAVEALVLTGDLRRLSAKQRIDHYNAMCRALGLNPATQPFDYIEFGKGEGRKLKLYARRNCTDQLRRRHGISCEITYSGIRGTFYVAECRASMPDGRFDDDCGVVPFYEQARDDDAANSLMIAVTKAKRRATLSLLGLSLLDESELDTMPAWRGGAVDLTTGEITDPAGAAPSGAAPSGAASTRAEPRAKRREAAARALDQVFADLRDVPPDHCGNGIVPECDDTNPFAEPGGDDEVAWSPPPRPDRTAYQRAMFRANDKAVFALAGERADPAVVSGLRWAFMSLAAERAARALLLPVELRPAEPPLHRHALALARRVDPSYDGRVVDVTRLSDEELARLAQGMNAEVTP